MKTYTTTRGVTVEILAIQTLLEKFEASARLPKVPEELADILGDAMPKPDAPTYDVKTLTGKVETYLHDETTVETDAEKAAWAKYKDELAVFERERNERLKRLVFLHGLRLEVSHDDTWVQAQEEIGINVPTDPIARKLHYIETEVCGGVGDFVEILKLCMMAGLPEEKLREAEELFQRSLGQYTVEGARHPAGQVESE